ncbi:MAG: hypothetical protein KatS3mg095_0302 [Candidatus Parcubacteria bacterium]|nr:MAG: hypothetical protein KatS3mg095_0302 [Candidatus Parcubacteria bacterium]
MKTGTATFSLDTGRCPKWLFNRMKKLAGIMSEIIVEEFGAEEFLKRLANPYWFQSFGCALAFDWNSSGLTVTTTAALKEALRELNLGIYICGGKGKTSKKTPEELIILSEKLNFDPNYYIKISKLTAKIDNSLIQDNFNIYHHTFLLTSSGKWAVIQQGMNVNYGLARRYHWLGDRFDNKLSDITENPHSGIISEIFFKQILNLTAKESNSNKQGIIKILNEEPKIEKEIYKILSEKNLNQKNNLGKNYLFLPNVEFNYHPVIEEKFDVERIKKYILKAKFIEPKTIEDLILIEGVGSKTIRALSLISEIIYGAKPSYQDPARYTFVNGGKDDTPYPVERAEYDKLIEILNKAIKISKQQKFSIFK